MTEGNQTDNSIDIGYRFIGSGSPVLIIAEAGVNHNGDLEIARRLIDAAKIASVDVVKFQTWVTEKIITPDAPMAEYQVRNVGDGETQYEMLKRLELSYDQFRELKAYADQQQVLFCSTPDEEDSADFLDDLGVSFFKIGSGEVTNLPLLIHVAAKGKPIILSTGMSTLAEVERAVRVIEQTGNTRLVLLHCVSNYPADPADCNLRAMESMSREFGYPVGFSDHTMGIEIALAAVALGACVIEKHFTLDREMPGPDHPASINTDELKELVRAIRSVESALGTGVKHATGKELDVKKVVQKTIVAARRIRRGETIAPSDLALRRTSGGLPPLYLETIIGQRTNRELAANQAITLEMLG